MTWQSCRSLAASIFALGALWATTTEAADAPHPKGDATVGMSRRPVGIITEKIYFATNRKRTDSRSPSHQFGRERANVTTFGAARVSLAASAEDDFALAPATQALTTLSWSDVAARLSKAPRVLLLVHGFNNTFEEAVAMASRLKRNMRTDAAILLVSWPSQGTWTSYFQDEEEALLSARMMASVLTDVAQSVSSPKLQILAHSLGSRVTVNAMRKIFDSSHREVLRRFSHIALAAPDIHRDWMDQEFLPVLEAFRIPTTIYVSDPDVWIGFSEFIHGHPRVGSFWSHLLYLRPLVTTVDISSVATTSTGHSVIFSPSMLYELYFLLERELPTEQRPWLWRIDLAAGSYWRLVPQLVPR